MMHDITQSAAGFIERQLAKPKRRRRAHFKSHGGCYTCKIRKKKCDETRPACLRCTSTGRHCDGYITKGKILKFASAPAPANTPHSNLLPTTCTSISNYGIDCTLDNLQVAEKLLTPRYPTMINYNQANNARVLVEEFGSSDKDCQIMYSDSPSASTVISRAKSTSTGQSHHNTRRNAKSSNLYIRHLSMVALQLSDLESQCFDFFRLRTGPGLAAYLGSSIWRSFAIKAGVMHPAVISCIVAVGAVHRRHEYGISREAFEYCAYALRFHNKAYKELIKLRHIINTNRASPEDRDIIVTCEVLLGLFQNFQGEDIEAVKHIHLGIRQLLNRPLRLEHRESHNYNVNSRPNLLLRVLQKLIDHGDALFDRPACILSRFSDVTELPRIPSVFESLEEARDFIFTEVDWISQAVFGARSRVELQTFHVGRILQWGVSQAETVKNLERTPQLNRACKLMKTLRCIAYGILYVGISTPFHVSTDFSRSDGEFRVFEELWRMMEQQEEIVADMICLELVVETYLNQQSPFHYTEHDLSFDSAIGPPRDNQLKPESSAKTRHMVRYMNSDPSKTDLWPNLGLYGIAERAGGLEEHAVISAIKDLIPDANLVWTDITCMMEDRKILLRYCKPDNRRPGLLWTQEWWSF